MDPCPGALQRAPGQEVPKTISLKHKIFCFVAKRISSKTLSTSSLTINGALIVKDEVDKVFEPSLMLTAWIAANVYAYVHGHTRTPDHDQQNKQEETRGQPRTVVGPRPTENQLLQCFEFHDKHGRNRRKRTHLF